MSNIKYPDIKGKTSICEIIQQVVKMNPSARFTKSDIDSIIKRYENFMKRPRTAQNERSRQDSIVSCYHAYGLRDCPDVAYNNELFSYSPGGWNGNLNKSKVGTTRTNVYSIETQNKPNIGKNYIQPQRVNSGINNNSDDEELPKGMLRLILGFMGIALVIALFFNVLGIREIIMKLAVIGGLGFLGYKIINAKNTGFNLAGRLFILIAIILAVYGSMFR